jgi:predicted nucleic acid-binding protein
VKQDTAADARILPASALAEVLVAPMRRDPRDAEKVDQALAAVAIRVEPLTREVARAAAGLRARHRTLRLPDELVLATGEVFNALVVTATEVGRRSDGRHGRYKACLRQLGER